MNRVEDLDRQRAARLKGLALRAGLRERSDGRGVLHSLALPEGSEAETTSWPLALCALTTPSDRAAWPELAVLARPDLNATEADSGQARSVMDACPKRGIPGSLVLVALRGGAAQCLRGLTFELTGPRRQAA